ncbi:MAG: gamma-glutamyltransferase [bacterium]|nr:gamma-glutamyltransferase [bacterium]
MKPRGVVAAGHEQTARAAEAILREGGNAFDAALGAMVAACVTEPVLASLGGGGFLLAHPSRGKSLVYDFFVHTPRTRVAEEHLDFRPMEADFGTVKQTFHFGRGSIATPGLIRGLFEVHRDLGSMPMRDVVAPALQMAREGVRVNALQAYILQVVSPIFVACPQVLEAFGSPREEGGLVVEGDVLRMPEMADTLEILSIEGDDLFYRGEIAQLIDHECREGGGCLRLDDLEHYEVLRREPLTVDYRDVRVQTNPPPSSGGILVGFALRLLQQLRDFGASSFGSHRHLSLLAKCMELTNKARVDAHADDASAHLDNALLLDGTLLGRYREEILGRAEALRGTTHVNVIDADDNVATLTVSNGEGCGYLLPRTGIMLNNMLGEEDLNPQGFHCWEPDERMTSMMSPSLIYWKDGRIVATGSGGSNRIRTAILQVIVNLVDHGMSVEDAVASPRIFHEGDTLSVENGFRDSELSGLLEDFPRHELWGEQNLYFGGAHTVEHEAGGGFHGAGDPRRGGVCLVVD